MRTSLDLVGTWLIAILTNKIVALTLGGVLGTHSRYWLGRGIDALGWTRGFPSGTLVVNVTGSFLLGLVAVIVLERLPPAQQAWYFLLGTGFCGAFTTFSTFEWETFKLLRDGNFAFALLNIVGSVLAGLAAVVLAVVAVEILLPRR